MAIIVLDKDTELADTVLARPPRAFKWIPSVIIGLLAVAGWWAYVTEVDTIVKCPIRVRARSSPSKDFNTVSGQKVSACAAGRVTRIGCKEGDTVKLGDVLMELDTATLDNDIAGLERQEASGNAEVEQLSRMIVALEAERDSTLAKADREIAEAEINLKSEQEQVSFDRESRAASEKIAAIDAEGQQLEVESNRELLQKNVVSKVVYLRTEFSLKSLQAKLEASKLQKPEVAIEVAARRLETIRSNRELQARQLQGRILDMQLQLLRRRGELDQTHKSLANLKLERSRCTLTAPLSGVVTLSKLEPGDHVEAGTQVAAIAETGAFRIDAAAPASEIGRVKPGMTARIKLDAFDFRKYGTLEATVLSVTPDTELVDGKSIAYLVEMDFDAAEMKGGGSIRLGMTGQAEIMIEKDRLLWMLFRKLKKQAEVN